MLSCKKDPAVNPTAKVDGNTMKILDDTYTRVSETKSKPEQVTIWGPDGTGTGKVKGTTTVIANITPACYTDLLTAESADKSIIDLSATNIKSAYAPNLDASVPNVYFLFNCLKTGQTTVTVTGPGNASDKCTIKVDPASRVKAEMSSSFPQADSNTICQTVPRTLRITSITAATGPTA